MFGFNAFFFFLIKIHSSIINLNVAKPQIQLKWRWKMFFQIFYKNKSTNTVNNQNNAISMYKKYLHERIVIFWRGLMGMILKLFYLTQIPPNFGCCVKQRKPEFNHSQISIVLLSILNILYTIVGVTKQMFACDQTFEDALFIPNHDTITCHQFNLFTCRLFQTDVFDQIRLNFAALPVPTCLKHVYGIKLK